MSLGDGQTTGHDDLPIAELLHEVVAQVPGLDNAVAKVGFLVPADFLVPGDTEEARLAGKPLPAIGEGAVQLVTGIDTRKPGFGVGGPGHWIHLSCPAMTVFASEDPDSARRWQPKRCASISPGPDGRAPR